MSDDLCTLWCGNIPEGTKDEILYELFLQAGPIERFHRPKHRDTNAPRNFAFIKYEDEESVPYAMELFQETRLHGQELRLECRALGNAMRQHQRSNSMPVMNLQENSWQPKRPPLMPPQWQQQQQPQWQQQQQQQMQQNALMLQQMAQQQMMMQAQQQWQPVATFQPGWGPYGAPFAPPSQAPTWQGLRQRGNTFYQ